MVCEYEFSERVIRVNCLGCVFGSSIEDFEACMAKTIDKLLEKKDVERIVLAQARETDYSFEQVKMLLEIANAYNKILNEKKLLNLSKLAPPGCERFYSKRLSDLQFLLLEVLRKDPIGAYVKLNRMIKQEELNLKKALPELQKCHSYYLENTLLPIKEILEGCSLIQKAKPRLSLFKFGDRSLYRELFSPAVRPNFMLTRFMVTPPKNGLLVDKYHVGPILVEIFKVPEKVRFIYHVTPPEFVLSEEKYSILDSARRYLAEHKPTETEITEPEKAREVFLNIGRDLIKELAGRMNLTLTPKEVEELATILARYTAGFGVLEILLADEKIQDIFINSPIGATPIYVNHSEFEECETNLIPTREDADAWATRFRLYSGRPLDEANPVLDTELIVPGGRARVAAITRTLSPEGLAFAFRRHREKPWTFPLFIKAKTFNPLYAGLMSFIIDGGRSMLIAGGRGSGKTSLLGAIITEIMPKFRIIVCEDTLEIPVAQIRQLGYNIERLKSRSVIVRVETELPAEEALRAALRLGDSVLIIGEVRSSLRGSEEVLIVNNGIAQRVKIKDLEGKDLSGVLVPTLNKNYKFKLSKIDHFVKHPPRSKFIRVTTCTGRSVIVTPEHSLFTNKNFNIVPVRADELKVGDNIVIPSSLPNGFNDVSHLDLTRILKNFRIEGAEKYIRKAIKKLGRKNSCKVCGVTDIYMYLRPGPKRVRIPVGIFLKLMEKAKIRYDINKFKIKKTRSNALPAKLTVNEDFCRFLGYYISGGWIECTRVGFSNSNPSVISDIKALSKSLFNSRAYTRETKGCGKPRQILISNSPLAVLIKRLGCGSNSKNKRIPPFIYGVSKKKIYAFLRGLYSGNGTFVSTERFGNYVLFSTISKKLAEDLLYLLTFCGIVGRFYKKWDKCYKNWKYYVYFKLRADVRKFLCKACFNKEIPEMLEKSFSHTKGNVVKFDPKELEKHVKLLRKFRHLRKLGRCTKYYLQKLTREANCDEELKSFSNGDFYLDEIKKIEEINLDKPEPVFDLSVNPTENFVGGFGGILLHNTEAIALFEAMRIGAMANVVAGTIHGETAYGVFDRVVHDLGVPPTSFKALDVITICNLLKTPDGLRRFRRVTELTEVRKHWKEDPMEEGAFVNLMEYSAKEDKLKPTATLLDGESQVLNEIAKRVREWRGRWDAVWDNILLRAKIKETIVEYSLKLNKPEILEAEFVTEANSIFHLISEKVRQEVGALDSKLIFERWLEWFKKRLSQ